MEVEVSVVELLVTICWTCQTWWENDYDPPECNDPEHNHELLVLTQDSPLPEKLYGGYSLREARIKHPEWFDDYEAPLL